MPGTIPGIPYRSEVPMASSAASTNSALTRRDHALLAAVAAGRCALTPGPLPSLLIDGRGACDQLGAYQLLAAGFIRPSGRVGQLFEVELTEAGRAATKP